MKFLEQHLKRNFYASLEEKRYFFATLEEKRNFYASLEVTKIDFFSKLIHVKGLKQRGLNKQCQR